MGGNNIEILSGLEKGDLIISVGFQSLNDGDEVEFIEVEEWSEYLSLIIKYGKIIKSYSRSEYNDTFGSDECQFEPTTNTSSATICANCGREKFLHKT